MKIKLPADLPTDPAAAYRQGYRDAITASARRAGSATSEAKAASSKENGRGGGRPKIAGTPEEMERRAKAAAAQRRSRERKR